MAPSSSGLTWRKIHRWCGLALAAFVIFYSLTGLLLNHRKDFGYFQSRNIATVAMEPLQAAALQDVLAECRRRIGRADDPRVIRIPDNGTIEFLYGSHGKTTYRIKPGAAFMEIVEKKSVEPFSWLNSLHKISGEKKIFWLICADLVCVLAVLLTISGLNILRYRRLDYLLLMAGVLLLFLGVGLA